MGFLEKTPRLDLDFDQLRDDAGKSLGVAAQVFQLIDEEIFDNEIFNNSVSRQAGLGLKGEIAPVIREAITGQVRIIQEIINRLPSEMAQILNEALLNTAVDIESKVKGDRLLEFDETKKIAEKFKAFIEGDLQARFVFSIREFFIEAFEALGALPDAARQFVEQEFETFQGLNREQRAKFGENFVQEFGAVVDAFNIINGNAPDSLNGTINALKNLADTLGFEAVPSIAQLDAKLEELISAAEFDPSVIADMLALRSAILQVQAAIISSLSSITSALAGLNNSLATAGGTGLDLTGLIQQGLDATLDLLAQEGLSSEDVEALLGQATGFANQLLAEEQRLFNEQQTVLRQASEAQKAGIQAQISSLNEVKTQIQEISRLRLDTLNEELNVAQQLESLFDSITKTLDGIIFSSNSVLTPIEQVSILQSRISSLQAEIQGASGSALAELGKELETALSQLFGSAGDAFGVNSPEFVAIFDQVTTGLADLQDLTEGASRSSEEIQAEIEALQAQTNLELQEVDESINALNDRLASINSQVQENTFVASQALQDTLTFLQGEYVQLFNDRMEQLAEVSNEGFATEILALEAVVDKQQEQIQLEAEQTIVLRSIESLIGNVPRFNEGGFVPPGVNTFAMLHGGREGETVTPGNGNVSISVTVNDVSGNSQGTADFMLNAIARDIRRGGVVSQAIEDRR
jgi:hypothetical protein